MRSGIVYFEEILENVKDATGIENLRPLYPKIRRFIFNAENEIGAGGVVVVKKKQYTIGDGSYDGARIILPYDFVSEWSYGSLADGRLEGNTLKLFNTGKTEVDLTYLGFLLDQNGNPFTTRNRLGAVIANTVFRLYSAKAFMKEGSMQAREIYKQEYYDAVMEARGNDAFPTEEEWAELGRTKLGGTFEAMTNCGMMTVTTGSLDPIILDIAEVAADPTCIAPIEGISYGSAIVLGEVEYMATLYMEGVSNSSTSVTGTMRLYATPESALIGVSNGSASVLGLMVDKIVIVQCDESFSYNGGVGTFSFRLELGLAIGTAGIIGTAYAVPDRFRIEYNGVEVANSKFMGISVVSLTPQLLALGYTQAEIDLVGVSSKTIEFNKASSSPSYAIVYVDAPIGGTAWRISGICPY